MKYFTESHEWIQMKGRLGTVGITAKAQKELGEVVYIELPRVGEKIKAGQEVCVLESTKAAADLYAPVSGTVTKVNEHLKTDPSLINHHPETQGWLFELEVESLEELKRLETM